MRTSPPFLDRNELEQFERDYHLFRRTAAKRTPGCRERPRRLDKLMADALGEVARRGRATTGRALSVVAISVRPGDGLDWSATALDQAAASAARSFEDGARLQRLHLRGSAEIGGLPEIAKAVGARRLARLAQKHGVTTSFRVLSPWLVPVVATPATALILLLSSLLGGWTKAASSYRDLLTPPLIALAIATAAAKVTLELLAVGKTRFTSKEMAELATEVTRRIGSEAHDAFVDSVAAYLRTYRLPRCLIVTRYERLDITTQRVLERYLGGHSGLAADFELWVILENSDAEEFNKVSARQHMAEWHEWYTRYDQLLLSDEDRTRLAEYSDHPDRRDFRTVTAIRHPERDGGELDRFFKAYTVRGSRAREHYEGLDLFYLLAVASGWGGRPQFSESTLLDKFAQKNLLRSHVLRQVLVGSALSKSELRGTLRAIREEFERFIEVDHLTSLFSVDPTCGRFLAQHHDEYGLPPARLVHLYWALLCDNLNQSGASTAFWARKQAAHLLEAASPDVAGAASDSLPALEQAFFDAVISAIREGLDWCLPEQVGVLLELLSDLISEGDPDDPDAARGRVRRARELAWRAYSVFSDDRIIRTLLRLRSSAPDAGRRGRQIPASALEDLFLATLQVGRDDRVTARAQGVDSRAAYALADSPDDLHCYAKCRSSYLSHALLDADAAFVMPRTKAARQETFTVLPGVIRSSCERIRRGPERVTVDLLAVSLGLWSLTFGSTNSTDGDPSEELATEDVCDLLLSALLAADYLGSTRQARERHHGPDIVLDLLLSELWAVLVICGLRLAGRHVNERGDVGGQGPVRDLVEVLQEATRHVAPAGGSPQAWGDTVGEAQAQRYADRRLEALALIYDSLGLVHLRSLLNIRMAEWKYQASAPPRVAKANIARAALDELAPEFDAPGANRLLALGVAGSMAMNPEIGAKFRLAAAETAVSGGCPSFFGVELCLQAICIATDYGYDVSKELRYIIADEGQDTPREHLSRVLADVPDGMLRLITPQLLQACTVMGTTVATEVHEVLRERVQLHPGSPGAEDVSQELELFELERSLRTGAGVDARGMVEMWKASHGDGPTVHYAWLLLLLLDRDPGLLDEATALLRGVSDDGGSNAYLLLASDLALALDGQEDETAGFAMSAAVRVFRDMIYDWQGLLPAEVNIRIFDILTRNARRGSEAYKGYRSSCAYWDAARHERDRVVLLPALVEQGRFFLLFLHYAKALANWNLPLDHPWGEVSRLLSGSGRERPEVLGKWRVEGERVPKPFVEVDGRQSLTSDFLIVGSYIFEPGMECEPGVRTGRERFDQVARSALRSLYALITSSPEIPSEIRSILARHRDSLGKTVMPEPTVTPEAIGSAAGKWR